MRRAGFALLFVVATAARPAAAETSAPSVTLTVTPGNAGGPWRVRITNDGELPVRIAADANLLSLELTRPAADPKKKVVVSKCVLPDDTRPSSDDGRELVVPAKRSWSAVFDPLFHCFGAKERAALVPGTIIRARYGWKAPAANAKGRPPVLSPPFAVSPVAASIGQYTPIKELESAAITLTDAINVEAPAASDARTPAALALTLSETLDALRGKDLGTTVTLANTSDRSITTMLRPDTLGFTVNGPGGSVACGKPKVVDAPIRESFSTLATKGKASVSLLLDAVCPSGTFDEPGLYRVIPKIDTRNASGRPLGLKTWDDEAAGKTPMLLRVRQPRRPNPNPQRPTLD